MGRTEWLRRLTRRLSPIFARRSARLPRRIKVYAFMPPLTRQILAGQCCHAFEAMSGVPEVYVDGLYSGPTWTAETLIHELAHAILGPGFGHGPRFKQLALRMGVGGPFQDEARPWLQRQLGSVLSGLPPWDHIQRQRGREWRGSGRAVSPESSGITEPRSKKVRGPRPGLGL